MAMTGAQRPQPGMRPTNQMVPDWMRGTFGEPGNAWSMSGNIPPISQPTPQPMPDFGPMVPYAQGASSGYGDILPSRLNDGIRQYQDRGKWYTGSPFAGAPVVPDDPAKLAQDRSMHQAAILSNPKLYAQHQQHYRGPTPLPKFDASLSRLTPDQQAQLLRHQGRGMWQQAVTQQQLQPGKGGSQPLGGIGVTTPGIPPGYSDYWSQQAQNRLNKFSQSVGGVPGPTTPGGAAPTPKPGGGGGGGTKPPAGGPPPGGGGTTVGPAGPGGGFANTAIGMQAGQDKYAAYGSQPSQHTRASVAANDLGKDTRGNVYTPGNLMNIARQMQTAGAPAPKGMEWLAQAPLMGANGDPNNAAIQQWYKQASQGRGSPGAFQGAQVPAPAPGGGAPAPGGGGVGGGAGPAAPPLSNDGGMFMPPGGFGGYPSPWQGGGAGGPISLPYGPPMFPAPPPFSPPMSGGGGASFANFLNAPQFAMGDTSMLAGMPMGFGGQFGGGMPSFSPMGGSDAAMGAEIDAMKAAGGFVSNDFMNTTTTPESRALGAARRAAFQPRGSFADDNGVGGWAPPMAGAFPRIGRTAAMPNIWQQPYAGMDIGIA